MSKITQCANCEKAGLPILPVRYAVLPKMVSASTPEGISGEGVTQIGLTQHDYGLRTLREGWVYLFYLKGARGNAYWEAYEVTEDGLLWKGANLVIAVTSSGSLIQRLAGRKGYVVILKKIATGISDASARQAALAAGEVVVEVVGERGAMLAFGRAVLFLAGWEVMIAVTLIQGLVWYFSDHDLQTWFENCTFGVAPKTSPPWTAKQQNEAFAKALEDVGLNRQRQQ